MLKELEGIYVPLSEIVIYCHPLESVMKQWNFLAVVIDGEVKW
jgi:hypothetical protein